MEMGVDIPDVSVVVNTNVPPAPSNYRQRVGRAGRRGEPWALSFTFCKDQPLDRRVFSDPHTLLQGEVRAPSVRLDSAIVLQRHANSLLLAMHLRASSGGIKVTKNIGSFFGATDPTLDSASKQPILHDSAASGFLDALKGAWGAEGKVLDALRLLARGAPVADPALLRDRCIRDFSALQRKWEEEYRALLTAQEAAGSDSVVRGFYVNRANRMRREFLLTELARRNFTPAYGFPVDVVTFEHYDRNSGPSRPLSTAIRDYAPGTEVVIDGLVYRSEGILPSWSNRENPDRIEDLRTHWTCRECRAFGIERNPPEACPRCDGRVNRFELLKPSGFLGTKTPHAAYEALDFVPPEPPQISADSGFWTALPDPDAGRFRATRAGRVVTTSAGKDGSGYAICITCGRAEAETQGTDALSKAMKEHRPLQRPKGEARRDGRCLGTEAASLRIRRHVRLGSETITDVFELQLETLSWNKEGRRKGLAIVAALREALCSRLGIGAEEVGVGVARGLSSGGIERVSMFLYDLAAGGAGFAVSAEAEISSLMVDAARRLDCPSACTHGCPECILRRDLQFDMRAIDRPGGYEAMIRDVLPHLALPEDLRVFGSESTAVTRSLEAEILSCLGGGGVEEVILTLPGDDRDWDLPRWPGGRVIRRASEAGAATRVMSAVRSITYFDYPERMDLLRLTARGDAGLSLTQNLPEAGGYPILALLRKGASWRAILSPDETVVLPDGEWGQADRMPLIAGPAPEFNPGHLVEAVDLAKHGLPNSTEALVLKEFDGPLSEFGRKFWDKVREVRPQAFRPGLRLARLCYSDRYLHAPAPVALLMQVLATAPGRDPVTEVRVESEAKRPPRGATGLANTPLPDRLHHNWEDDSIRKRVLTGVLGAKVDLLDKRSVDHARIVRLQFEDGSCVSVRLDQGLGSWRVQEAGRDPFFDFEASANKQVEAISCLNREVLFSNPRYPTPVTVSWEASRIESRCC
ncbi:hypothetical protein CJ301_05725 [Limimaricola cinnabarinus]|uniref:Helicase C-terminal domain-containing protein n=2 Tax=Limimaricola cinnabarinus TaxID=1125964 RepID=A0A2G1MIZ2_9RHOB|nr:hypothetical protein CJ301_05725 [Limimaricola cinnabarinus]